MTQPGDTGWIKPIRPAHPGAARERATVGRGEAPAETGGADDGSPKLGDDDLKAMLDAEAEVVIQRLGRCAATWTPSLVEREMMAGLVRDEARRGGLPRHPRAPG